MAGPSTTLTDGPTHAGVGAVVELARGLRRHGVAASPAQVQALMAALDRLGPLRAADLYWAARLTLCASADDLACFDALVGEGVVDEERLAGLLRPEPELVDSALTPKEAGQGSAPPSAAEEGGGPEGEERRAGLAASGQEVLGSRDLAELTPAELDHIYRLTGVFDELGQTRRSGRWRSAPWGRADRTRTLRCMLAAAGEPTALVPRRPAPRSRRVVLLVDVSGSMAPYAGAMLRFAVAAARCRRRPRTEVFTLGTRLTQVTGAVGREDPREAFALASAAAVDKGGGTRLGELLEELLDGVGQRGIVRGSVTVVMSDGWERGDPALLGEQMARLSRLAHRVVWCNPRLGHEGYQPLARGMAAALPHVDDFVAGHSLEALARLAATVDGSALGPRHRAFFEEEPCAS